MKKLYTYLAVASLTVSASAQQIQPLQIGSIEEVEETNPILMTKAIDDTAGYMGSTLFSPYFAGDGQGAATYGHPNGGYIFGTNEGIVQQGTQLDFWIQGQGYNNDEQLNFDISEVLIWCGKATVDADNANTGTGNLTVEIVTVTDNRAIGQGSQTANTPGPNQTLGTTTLAFDDVDGSGQAFTSATFSTPARVEGTKFGVTVDVSDVYAKGDTLSFIADVNGNGMELNWQKLDFNGNWYQVSALFTDGNQVNLDNNVAFFPVIEDYNLSVEGNDYLFGAKMSAYPNPANTNVTIDYGIENNSSDVTIKLIDATGRTVREIVKGDLLAGQYKEIIDLTDLASGSYYYSVTTNKGTLTKKLSVVK